MHKKEVSPRDLKIFGLIWGAIFIFIAHKSQSMFPLLVALLFIFCSIICPRIFLKTRIYALWIRFGDFLGKINGFLISAILFYAIFTPIALILKLLKKDPLSKKLDASASSYFVDRKTQPHDMKHQF